MIKKISVALLATLAAFSITPAQAEEQKAIVIIDSYFDSSAIDGDVVHVCVVEQRACDVVSQPRTPSQFENFNHGTIMADIARSSNPNAKLILIRAASLATSVVTPFNFNLALDWVESNASLHNIKSVSLSYNLGNGDRCRPLAGGHNITDLHNSILNNVNDLARIGVKVYAAAGNHSGSSAKVDYPACISEVVSVGSNLFRGSMPLSDIVHFGFGYTSNVLKSNVKSLQNRSVISRAGSDFVRVGNTTSVATVIVASTN